MQSTRTGLNSFSYNYFTNPNKAEIVSYFSIVGPIFMGLLLAATELLSCCFKASPQSVNPLIDKRISEFLIQNRLIIKELSQKQITQFFRSVTPNNFQEKLYVARNDNRLDHLPYLLTLRPAGATFNFPQEPVGNYLNGWQSVHFKIINNKFVALESLSGKKIEFDNFADMLSYWMKGDFYQGKDMKEAPFFYIMLKDGNFLKYNNPHHGTSCSIC